RPAKTVCGSCSTSRSAPINSSTRSSAPRPARRHNRRCAAPEPHLTEGLARMSVVAALLLAAAAWFGHAFLMTVGLNLWYALPLSRRLHKLMRAIVALLVFSFPFAL